ISGPVHTQFGWHVIKIEDKRIKPPPTFDQVKAQIKQYVERKAQAALVEKLRGQAKIEKFYKTADESKQDQPAAASTPAKADTPAKDAPAKK
ncbi:MAG: peptidylprolyl isomerase, partial [Pseudolabrys sp.]